MTQCSDDGRWLLAHDKNAMCLYDLAKHASDCKRQITDNPPRAIVSARFSPDSKWLLIGNFRLRVVVGLAVRRPCEANVSVFDMQECAILADAQFRWPMASNYERR